MTEHPIVVGGPPGRTKNVWKVTLQREDRKTEDFTFQNYWSADTEPAEIQKAAALTFWQRSGKTAERRIKAVGIASVLTHRNGEPVEAAS